MRSFDIALREPFALVRLWIIRNSLRNSMQSKDRKVLIESKNIWCGSMIFLEFEVPHHWNVSPIPARTEVLQWKIFGEARLVMKGYTHLALYVEGKSPITVPLQVNSNHDLNPNDWLSNQKEKLGSKILQHEHLNVNGHEACYTLHKEEKKKFFFFGKEYEEFILRFVLPCEVTERTIFFKAVSRDSQDLISTLPQAFSSFKCHGTFVPETEESDTSRWM